MKKYTIFWGMIGLAVICLGCAALSALGGMTLDLGSGRVYSPMAEAQATRTAQLAQDEAAARALAVETERKAQPAAVTGRAVFYIGLGLAGVVLVMGMAFGFVAWLNKRATSVYPNSAGQYPVIVRRGFGWVTFHDPNRQLSSAAVYRTPTALDVLASAMRYFRTGKAPALPGVVADFPPTGSEPAMLQVASQAGAVSLMSAATRPAGILGSGERAMDPKEARGLASQLAGGGAPVGLPAVRVIDDPRKIEDFRMIVEGIGND